MPKTQAEARVWSRTMADTDTVWFQPKLTSADKSPRYKT